MATSRRQKGTGTVFRRARDGMWVASFDAGWTEQGTRRRKTFTARTRADAVEKMRTAQRELLVTGRVADGRITVKDWLERWLDEIAAPQVKPKTLASYRSVVKQYLVPVIGRRRLATLNPADVRAVHAYMEGKGRSSTTMRHAHNLLLGALKAAQREGLATGNAAADTPRPARERRQPEALTAEQAVRLLRAVDDDRLATRWLAALSTGARQGELLGLRWSHVDLEAGTFDLAWSLQRAPYSHGCSPTCGRRPDRCPQRHIVLPRGLPHEVLEGNVMLVPPKTRGSTRVVPLSPPLLAAMTALHKAARPAPRDLVWSREDGRPIDSREDYKAWRAALEAAGLPAVSLHSARHTAATLMMEAGQDTHIISSILGHSDVITTRGYQHVSLEQSRRAVAVLGEALTLPSGPGR